MSTDYLISVLNDVNNAARVNRERASNIVLQKPELIKNLVALTFEVDNKLSIKAAWVLEWICIHHNLEHILPFLDTFTQNIAKIHFDSVIRPCAKICEQLATVYASKTTNKVQQKLTQKHVDLLIETGFDWLLNKQKIAVKAYTMSTLYYLGLEKDWVHNELEHLIKTKVIHESKACTARGKHVLALIQKQKRG